jgi:hypothetical protein
MIGFKGKVHVAFGEELRIVDDDPNHIALDIDAQILQNYVLNDVNYLAIERLKQDGMLPLHLLRPGFDKQEISAKARSAFEDRLNTVDPKLMRHWLYSYANPVIARFKIE